MYSWKMLLLRKRFPLITVFSVLLCVSLVFSVEAASMWSQTYGGTSNDAGFSVVETIDGGYAVAGNTVSSGAGFYDFWLVKTDENGVVPESSWVILPLLLIATLSIFISKKKLLHIRSKNNRA
jgi:hypothetical protein